VFVAVDCKVPEESFQVPSSLLEVMSPFLQLVMASARTAKAKVLLSKFFMCEFLVGRKSN
jgi:hypothetical protein